MLVGVGGEGRRETLSDPSQSLHPFPVISTPPWVVSNLVFVHHQPITWQPCPYPQRRRDAAAWWGFCILNSISWWDKGCRNRALPLCKISVSHKPFLAASSDTDCGEKRHWAWGVGIGGLAVGKGWGVVVVRWDPIAVRFFLLFLICRKAARRESSGSGFQGLPSLVSGRHAFRRLRSIFKLRKFSLPSLSHMVDLPNIRYHSADR